MSSADASTQAEQSSGTPALAMRGISKTFGTTIVLEGVDLEVAAGEVHALLGQNGAGKSTLVKVLGGIYPDHGGTVEVGGETVKLSSPRQALAHGIGMIYQELSLIPSMSVAQNIMLGIEPGAVRMHASAVRERAAEVLASSPLLAQLPLDARVEQLGAGRQQMVEIAKALARNARVLVLDEPTARLSGPERDGLHALMRELATTGTAMVYISHFLDDVVAVADRLTVLRNGRVVAGGSVSQFGVEDIVRAMLSRELLNEEYGEHPSYASESVAMTVQGVDVGDRVKDISFTVRQGEIAVITGLVGSGRTQLVSALAGHGQLRAGQVLIDGRQARYRSPRQAQRAGVVMVAEDRKVNGIIGTAPARDNLILQALNGKHVGRFGIVPPRTVRNVARSQFEQLDVQPPRPGLEAASFSGGNQQKLLMGRALLAKPKVLIVDQPTAGVDVGAKQQIHSLLRDAAKAGAAVLVVSDDLDEVLALADTVLVMRHGRLIATEARAGLDRESLVETISA